MLTESQIVSLVRAGYMTLLTVPYQTEEICLTAVKRIGSHLQYVENQTEDICIAAIKSNNTALEYVIDQTEEMILLAVQDCHNCFKYVRNKTFDITKKAVMVNPKVIQFATNHDEEMLRHVFSYIRFDKIKIRSSDTLIRLVAELYPHLFHRLDVSISEDLEIELKLTFPNVVIQDHQREKEWIRIANKIIENE